MNPLSLYWHLLTIFGKLPEELILKILFQYGGLRHPNVNLLLESTKNEEFEALQKLPFSNSIYKFYLNKEKYNNLFDIDIIHYINNKQYSHGKQCGTYINHADPGYFIPRQFGRLYYTILKDDLTVVMTQEIDWSNHLARSKKILESKIKKYDKIILGEALCNRNHLLISNLLCRYNKNLNSFTHKLIDFEKKEKVYLNDKLFY
jgi:hypothetical protein